MRLMQRHCLLHGAAVVMALCVFVGAVAAAPSSLPGTEITPQDMERAFPKPLERRAPHMPFSPGPAPLLPEALPMRVPEPPRPAATMPRNPGAAGTAVVPQAPALRRPQGKGAPEQARPPEAAQEMQAAKGAVAPHQPPSDPTVEMMVGQMLMVGFSGAELKNNAPVLDLAARGVIGGVLFLPRDSRGPRNIVSPAQLRVLTATLQKAAREGQGSGGVPLFLAVEQEGGVEQALDPKLGFEGGAAAARLGRGSTEATTTAARRMALEMVALGLNFNFAPVADVNVNPLSEEIGKKFRSFSPHSAQAGAHALAFGQGMAMAGIVPCLKYFPGTGSLVAGGFAPAAGEAHFGPPDLAGRWQMQELAPFREALRQQWPGAVQPTLAYHRGLDALYPATLSARMLTDILREQLGFSGVIVSNDLEALERFYPLEEALLLAVRAGADMLLLPARQGIVPAAPSPALPGLPGGLEGLAGLSNGLGGLAGGLEGLSTAPKGAGLSGLGALSGGGGLAGLLSSAGILPGMKAGAPEKTGLVSGTVTRAHAALVQMVRDGRISQERLRQSWHRIMKIKTQFLYPKNDRTTTP